MKLSSRGRYAIRALFHIAYFGAGGAAQVRDIADRQAIPARFLEQIFQDLKRANLVSAKRGPNGGYSLSRTPEQISIGDVLRALEGPVQLVEAEPSSASPVTADCVQATNAVFKDLSVRLQGCLDEVTLADVCVSAEGLGVPRPNARRANYVI